MHVDELLNAINCCIVINKCKHRDHCIIELWTAMIINYELSYEQCDFMMGDVYRDYDYKLWTKQWTMWFYNGRCIKRLCL
jgi:hypothetical protein